MPVPTPSAPSEATGFFPRENFKGLPVATPKKKLESIVSADMIHQMEAFGPLAKPEADPSGLSPHTPGAKLDAGKPMPGLVLGDFARALQAVTDVGTYGARKYTPHGWVSVDNGISRYTDAMHRHLLKEAVGESRDADTGLLHAAHAAWNALARLDLMLREQEKVKV